MSTVKKQTFDLSKNSKYKRLESQENALDRKAFALFKQREAIEKKEINKAKRAIEKFIKNAPRKTKEGFNIKYYIYHAVHGSTYTINGYKAVATYTIPGVKNVFHDIKSARKFKESITPVESKKESNKKSSKTVTLAQAKKMVKDAEKAVMRKLLKDKITQQPTQPPAVEAKDII
jgi:D-aminopeptidase